MTPSSLPRLSAALPGILRRQAAPAPGIVHLGLGNFHRAHQAVYTDAAVAAHGGDWGIIGVSSRSSAVPAAYCSPSSSTSPPYSPTRRVTSPRAPSRGSGPCC